VKRKVNYLGDHDVSKKKKKRDKQPPVHHPAPQPRAAPTDDVSQIYMQYREMVFNEANGYLHDGERARDITSEAFKRFLTSQPTVLKPGQWLRKVARNLALNALRDQKTHDDKLRRIERSLSNEFRYAEDLSGAAIDAARVYALAYAPDSPLDISKRHVLQMFIDELSIAEMARRTGLPESTMRDLRTRVLNAVRQLLHVREKHKQ